MGDDMAWAKDMDVIDQKREKPKKTTQNMKMSKGKKGLTKKSPY